MILPARPTRRSSWRCAVVWSVRVVLPAAVAAVTMPMTAGATMAVTHSRTHHHSTSPAPHVVRAALAPGKINNIFVIEFENEGYDATFGAGSPGTYLNGTLRKKGVLLQNYYAIGHDSLDNYIAQVSGQSPTEDTQADCADNGFAFANVTPGTPDTDTHINRISSMPSIRPTPRHTWPPGEATTRTWATPRLETVGRPTPPAAPTVGTRPWALKTRRSSPRQRISTPPGTIPSSGSTRSSTTRPNVMQTWCLSAPSAQMRSPLPAGIWPATCAARRPRPASPS